MGYDWMVIICHRNSKCTFGANKTPMLASLAFGANKHVKLSSVILFRLVKVAVPGLGHEVTGQKYFYHFFHPLFVHQPL